MERSHGTMQGELFAREAPLPATAQKELLPLLAALVTTAMTAGHPSATRRGGGDDDA